MKINFSQPTIFFLFHTSKWLEYVNVTIKTFRDHGCLFVEFETSKGVLVSLSANCMVMVDGDDDDNDDDDEDDYDDDDDDDDNDDNDVNYR